MADNISTTAGTFAADDIGSVYYERLKLVLGADGVNDGDVHSSNPLPVTVTSLGLLTTYANSTNTLLVNLSSNGASSNALLSTIAARVLLNSSLALQATLANVSTYTKSTADILGGSLAASSGALWVQSVPGSAQATVSTTDLIRVALYGASDNQITSFGGGTQYVDGNTSTLPTGTVMLWKSAVSTLVPPSSSQPLPMNLVSSMVSIGGGTQYVEGNSSTAPTGTVMLWKSAVSTMSPVTTSLGLPVNVIAGSLNANTEYVDGNTTTLPTGIVMLWKSAVSTLVPASTSNPFPISSLPLTANLGTISSIATQATLAEVTTYTASSVSLLSTIALRTLLTSSLGLQATLAEISTYNASSVSLLSSNKLRLETISTHTNSTNTLLVQVSSTTASSNALLSTIALRLAPVPTGIYVQPVPVSSNGLTPYMTLDCNNSTQQVVSTAATLYGVYFANTSSKASYLKIWDGVSSATFVSSTAATMCIPCPGNSTDVIAGNFNAGNGHGIKMSTGICIAGVFGPNNNNSTQIGISTLIVNLFYKS